MLDRQVRAVLGPGLDRVAVALSRRGVTPNALTAIGFALGIGSAVAAGARWWWLALVLWLTSRLADGLDGPVARLRGSSDLGGYLDIVADFAVYGAFAAGVAVAVPEARVAGLALLVAYYVNGTAFLAYSSIAERRQQRGTDGRSLNFVGGLAEGTETIAVHGLFCLVPAVAPDVETTFVTSLAWLWTAVVGITALQRVAFARRALADDPAAPR